MRRARTIHRLQQPHGGETDPAVDEDPAMTFASLPPARARTSAAPALRRSQPDGAFGSRTVKVISPRITAEHGAEDAERLTADDRIGRRQSGWVYQIGAKLDDNNSGQQADKVCQLARPMRKETRRHHTQAMPCNVRPSRKKMLYQFQFCLRVGARSRCKTRVCWPDAGSPALS